MLKQTYQQNEAEQILREAVKRAAEQEAAQATGNADVSHERLVAMAEELGVSPETLAAVLNDRAATQIKEQGRAAQVGERQEFIAERKADFYPHLWSFIGVNVMLLAINLMTSPGHFWAAYPMLGWGIGLFCHAMAALPTRGPVFEKEFAGWRGKRREKAEKLRQKAEREREAAAKNAAQQQRRQQAKSSGARAYDTAPGEAAADAVRQVAGAVQEAVGVAAEALDDALRSLPREWPRPPRAPQRPRHAPRAPWWTDNNDNNDKNE